MQGAKAVVAATSGSSDSDKTSSQSSQPVVRRLKYEMCKNWREKGSCKYGEKCLFAHGEAELTKRSSANGPEPKAAANPVVSDHSKDSVVLTSLKSEAEITKPTVVAKSLFETPAKTVEARAEIQTPAFSTVKEMSTQQSTGNGKAHSIEQTFSKLSALAN